VCWCVWVGNWCVGACGGGNWCVRVCGLVTQCDKSQLSGK